MYFLKDFKGAILNTFSIQDYETQQNKVVSEYATIYPILNYFLGLLREILLMVSRGIISQKLCETQDKYFYNAKKHFFALYYEVLLRIH